MHIKQFWNKAVSYEVYLERGQESIDNPQTDIEKKYQQYYQLGIQRIRRMEKVYIPDPEQIKLRDQKDFKGKILIISETWCGDASSAIPIAHKFFINNEIRITYRDQEPSLIADFLTNGAKSIPILIFIDDNFHVIGHWGPRPAYGKQLFEKHKNNPSLYTEEQFHNDMQLFYSKDKGHATIQEILEVIGN